MPHTFWPPNGWPPPSIAMMPLTRVGRISATSQPNGPPAECVMMIAGPILSSSIAPRCRQTRCWGSGPPAGAPVGPRTAGAAGAGVAPPRPAPAADGRTGTTAAVGRRAAPSGRRCTGWRRVDVAASLRRDELIEVLRPELAGSRPLVVELPVRAVVRSGGVRRREPAGDALQCVGLRRERTVDVRVIRRPAVSRPIDDVDLVAFFEQNLRPAPPSVRCAHPVQSLAAAAVHEHHRIRMPHLCGDERLDIHLFAVHVGSAGELGSLDADEEIAPLGEVEHRLRGGARGLAGAGLRRVAEHPGRDGGACRRDGRDPANEPSPADPAAGVAVVQIHQAVVGHAVSGHKGSAE